MAVHLQSTVSASCARPTVEFSQVPLTFINLMEIEMDINVNKSEWDGLSAADRDTIKKIIASHFKDTIVPEASAPTARDFLAQRQLQIFNFSNPICTAACGVAEAAAVAACSALGGGVAVAVCVAVAHGAGDYCRSQC